MAAIIETEKKALMQKERIARAVEQAPTYEFEWHAPIRKWLVSKADGTPPYVLAEDASFCSCPDDCFRCQPQGLACKHRVALALHLLLNKRA